jgi:3-oxoacyl-[acyl-carrier protein] reductase
MKNYDGKSVRKVLITGATGGIGKATASCFAKGGWNIICHYNSSHSEARRLRGHINSLGCNCEIIKADFTKNKDLKHFVNSIKGIRIDALINNAGTYAHNIHFTKLSLEDLSESFKVNIYAPFLLAAAVFNNMKERKFGRIVNISSVAAKYGGSAYSMHYGCSKRALEGLTKTLAREGAAYNVLVNTVRPGVVKTDFHKGSSKDMKKRVTMIPIKRMGNPEEVADMVFYLGSAQNTFITNQVISVSGGE